MRDSYADSYLLGEPDEDDNSRALRMPQPAFMNAVAFSQDPIKMAKFAGQLGRSLLGLDTPFQQPYSSGYVPGTLDEDDRGAGNGG
jgi:hypothetical protein